MKTITVRRMNGDRVPVEFPDRTYYEVETENAAGDEWAYHLIAADTAPAARAALTTRDKVVGTRKLRHDEVAVNLLNGWEVENA